MCALFLVPYDVSVIKNTTTLLCTGAIERFLSILVVI
jgi:hypothetical protein